MKFNLVIGLEKKDNTNTQRLDPTILVFCRREEGLETWFLVDWSGKKVDYEDSC